MPNPKETVGVAIRARRDREPDQVPPGRRDLGPRSRDRGDPAPDRVDQPVHRPGAALGHGGVSSAVRAEVIAATRDHPTTEVRDLFERFVPESERIARLGDRHRPQGHPRPQGGCRPRPGHLHRRVGRQLQELPPPRRGRRRARPGPGQDRREVSAPELLQQIVEPSRTVDPKYTVYRLETKSGQVHSGLLVERNEKEVGVARCPEQRHPGRGSPTSRC